MNDSGLRLDAILSAAALEAEARELAAIPLDTDMEEACPLPKSLDGKIAKVLKRKKNKYRLGRVARFTKRVAACLVLVLAVTACVFAPVKAVREAVIATLVEWQDQFARFTFSSGSGNGATLPDDIGISVDDLPDGYTLVYEYTDSMTYNVIFQSVESEYIQVDIRQVSDSHHTYYDNEYTCTYLIEVMGTEVQWMAHSDGQNVLLWKSKGYVYVITSSEPLKICIEVAKEFL